MLGLHLALLFRNHGFLRGKHRLLRLFREPVQHMSLLSSLSSRFGEGSFLEPRTSNPEPFHHCSSLIAPKVRNTCVAVSCTSRRSFAAFGSLAAIASNCSASRVTTSANSTPA